MRFVNEHTLDEDLMMTGQVLADGLERLGFRKTRGLVCGLWMDFWQRDGYTFSARSVAKYRIVHEDVFVDYEVGGRKVVTLSLREKCFSTKKRNPALADKDILQQLEAWLVNPVL